SDIALFGEANGQTGQLLLRRQARRQVREAGGGFQRLGPDLAADATAAGWLLVCPSPADTWPPPIRVSGGRRAGTGPPRHWIRFRVDTFRQGISDGRELNLNYRKDHYHVMFYKS